MLNIKISLVSAALLFASAAQAQYGINDQPSRDYFSYKNQDYYQVYNAKTPVDPKLLNDFAEATLSHVILLPSDISTFSYAHLGGMGFTLNDSLTMSNPKVAERMRNLGAAFWNPDEGLDGNVSGTYVAFIPAQTHTYGGSEPFLMQIVLPRASRVLAVHRKEDAGAMRFDEGLKNRLRAIGCPVDDGEGGRNGWQATFVSMKASRACKTLVRAVVRKLEIEAILYPFFSEGSSCLEYSHNTAAILFPGPWIRERTVKVYGRSIPKPDPYAVDRYAISQYYPNLMRFHPEITPMWGPLPEPPGFSIDAWTQQNIWGCTPYFQVLPPL